MTTKLQLKHPQGKHAIAMDRVKYDTLKLAILSHLKSDGPSTHMQMQEAICEQLKRKKIKIEGSLNWQLEWVKLDLESRKEILRLFDDGILKFIMA